MAVGKESAFSSSSSSQTLLVVHAFSYVYVFDGDVKELKGWCEKNGFGRYDYRLVEEMRELVQRCRSFALPSSQTECGFG